MKNFTFCIQLNAIFMSMHLEWQAKNQKRDHRHHQCAILLSFCHSNFLCLSFNLRWQIIILLTFSIELTFSVAYHFVLAFECIEETFSSQFYAIHKIYDFCFQLNEIHSSRMIYCVNAWTHNVLSNNLFIYFEQYFCSLHWNGKTRCSLRNKNVSFR